MRASGLAGEEACEQPWHLATPREAWGSVGITSVCTEKSSDPISRKSETAVQEKQGQKAQALGGQEWRNRCAVALYLLATAA